MTPASRMPSACTPPSACHCSRVGRCTFPLGRCPATQTTFQRSAALDQQDGKRVSWHNATSHAIVSLSMVFLSAAQPTDQGEESVVLVVVVVGGGLFFSLPCAVFWGVKRQKTLSKKGCEKEKTSSKILFSTPQISESIPFLFLLFKSPHAQQQDLRCGEWRAPDWHGICWGGMG